MALTTWVVVTDRNGKVKDFVRVDGAKYESLEELSGRVSGAESEFRKKYPPPQFQIATGIASTLGGLLKSYPEITRSFDPESPSVKIAAEMQKRYS